MTLQERIDWSRTLSKTPTSDRQLLHNILDNQIAIMEALQQPQFYEQQLSDPSKFTETRKDFGC